MKDLLTRLKSKQIRRSSAVQLLTKAKDDEWSITIDGQSIGLTEEQRSEIRSILVRSLESVIKTIDSESI